MEICKQFSPILPVIKEDCNKYPITYYAYKPKIKIEKEENEINIYIDGKNIFKIVEPGADDYIRFINFLNILLKKDD